MKRIKFFAALVAILLTPLFTSCDEIKSLVDLELKTNYIVDVPVQLVNADAQSAAFNMSLSDVEDLNEYLDAIKDLAITDIEVSILNYKGDDYTGAMEITADGASLWSRNDVVASAIKPFTLIDDPNLDQDVLFQIAAKLLENQTVRGGVKVKFDRTEPMNTSFTIRCKFMLDVTVNPLNTIDE